MTPREAKNEPTMSNETTAEVLAQKIVDAQPFTEDNDATRVWQLFKNEEMAVEFVALILREADRLSRTLAAGKVAPDYWMVGDSVFQDEGLAQMEADEWGTSVIPLYAAPPADPAKSSEPDCSRDPIARKLDGAADTLRMLREDDSTTAKASGSAPDVWDRRRIVATVSSFEYDAELKTHTPTVTIKFRSVGADGPFDAPGFKDRDAFFAWLATPPASAPEVTEQAIERVAVQMLRDRFPERTEEELLESFRRAVTRDHWMRRAKNAIAALQEPRHDQ